MSDTAGPTSDVSATVWHAPAPLRPRLSDRWFMALLAVVGGSYLLLIVLMLLADVAYASPWQHLQAILTPEMGHSIRLTLWTCTLSAGMSLLVGVPLGYLLSRVSFPLRSVVDAVVDLPHVVPPLVLGLSLLLLFHFSWGGSQNSATLENLSEKWLGLKVAYAPAGIVLAQFALGGAVATRAMRTVFDQISPRTEQVAQTLGASRWQAVWQVTLPQAKRGMLTALTLAWSRALGEFGPILIFAGATRGRTDVLSTTVYLELQAGKLEAAVAVSLLMVIIALVVLLVVRQVSGVKSGG